MPGENCKMIKRIFLSLIRFYQLVFSPDQGIFSHQGNRICRFYPSCSEYTYQAIEKYGAMRGLFKGLKRILRCHPFNEGGCDPVL